MKLHEKKSGITLTDTSLHGGGALLDFHTDSLTNLSIWHPNCDEDGGKNDQICAVNSEIVQIRSTHGVVARSVSPRVKPKSYKCHTAAQERFFFISRTVDNSSNLIIAWCNINPWKSWPDIIKSTKMEITFAKFPTLGVWSEFPKLGAKFSLSWIRMLLFTGSDRTLEYLQPIATGQSYFWSLNTPSLSGPITASNRQLFRIGYSILVSGNFSSSRF